VTFFVPLTSVVDLDHHQCTAQEAGDEAAGAPFQSQADAVAEQDGQDYDDDKDQDDDVGTVPFHGSSFRSGPFYTL
jgi:hypothetical protein